MTSVIEHLLPHPPLSLGGLSPYFDLFRPADPVSCFSLSRFRPLCPANLLPALLNHCKPPSTPSKKRTLVHGWPSARKYLKRDYRKLCRSTRTKPAAKRPRLFSFPSLPSLCCFSSLIETSPRIVPGFRTRFTRVFWISFLVNTGNQSAVQICPRNICAWKIDRWLSNWGNILFERKIRNCMDSCVFRVCVYIK